jgi:hypothetical protein
MVWVGAKPSCKLRADPVRGGWAVSGFCRDKWSGVQSSVAA